MDPFQCLPVHGMIIIMRYARSHKAVVRERIVRAAATQLRDHGLEGPSVPDLMKEVGLTHGGFYGYFSGKEDLVAEAVRYAAQETGEKVFRRSPDLESALEDYLSAPHLRHPGTGCVVAALGAEGWRKGRKTRSAFADAARGLARLVDEKLGASPAQEGISDRALAITAQMLGTILLGRLVGDPELSEQVLQAGHRAATTLGRGTD